MQIFHQGFLGGEIFGEDQWTLLLTFAFFCVLPVTLWSNRSRTSIMNFAFESGSAPSLFRLLSLPSPHRHSPATCLTWVNISCSCSSMSLLADPSDLCSSMREKCSMLLMDSFSCRVKITSWNTDRRSGWEAKALMRCDDCKGTAAVPVNNYHN